MNRTVPAQIVAAEFVSGHFTISLFFLLGACKSRHVLTCSALLVLLLLWEKINTSIDDFQGSREFQEEFGRGFFFHCVISCLL